MKLFLILVTFFNLKQNVQARSFAILSPSIFGSQPFLIYFRDAGVSFKRESSVFVYSDYLCNIDNDLESYCRDDKALSKSELLGYIESGLIKLKDMSVETLKTYPAIQKEISITEHFRFHEPLLCNFRENEKLGRPYYPKVEDQILIDEEVIRRPPDYLFNATSRNHSTGDWFETNQKGLLKNSFYIDPVSGVSCLSLLPKSKGHTAIAIHYSLRKSFESDEKQAKQVKFSKEMIPLLLSTIVSMGAASAVTPIFQSLGWGEKAVVIGGIGVGIGTGVATYLPISTALKTFSELKKLELQEPVTYSPRASLYKLYNAITDQANITNQSSYNDLIQGSQYTDYEVITGQKRNMANGDLWMGEAGQENFQTKDLLQRHNIVKVGLNYRRIFSSMHKKITYSETDTAGVSVELWVKKQNSQYDEFDVE